MCCAPGLAFGSTEGVGSRFQVLHAQTHFRRYRGRRVPFSCFARPDSFSAVSRASVPVIKFCAPRFFFGGTEGAGSRSNVFSGTEDIGTRFLVLRARNPFGGTEGVGPHFHVLRARTIFRRYRGHLHPFSCFARPNSVSAVPRESAPVFMLCAPGLVFYGSEDVVSHFHVLRARTRFRRYRGRRVPY
jgi:hypothetical protein